MTLHAKLAEVYAIVERIPKAGKAPAEMGGYAFVQVGDAADPIRKALSERAVTMLPTSIEVVGQSEHEDSRNRIVTTCDVRVTWTFTDGETGESAVIQSMGSGQDRGDKYVPKALTNSMKYALLLGFLMPTGDEPEAAVTDDRAPRRAKGKDEKAPPIEYVSQGFKSFTGTVAKGDGQFNDVTYHEAPSGHRIGFRLDLGGGKAIHEVLLTAELGEAMYLTVPESELLGATVTVEGEGFRIDQAGRPPRSRLTASKITGPDFTIPAEPLEAPTVPMFDDAEQAKIDAAIEAAAHA